MQGAFVLLGWGLEQKSKSTSRRHLLIWLESENEAHMFLVVCLSREVWRAYICRP